MAIAKNKTTAIAVVMVLMLATSAAMMSIRTTKALKSLTVTPNVNQFMGQNTPGAIVWIFTPNILAIDPAYNSSAGPGLLPTAMVLANATVTFTRPDGTKDVVNGPFPLKPQVIGGAAPRLELIYTPNEMGTWTYTFYWPGDSTWAAVNYTNTFNVIGHFGVREGFAFLSMNPYPVVGLGQDILINAWVNPAPETSWQNYEGYTLTFTRPDGTSFTVGPMASEGPGTIWLNIPLDTLGNWTITFSFPGDYSTTACSVTRTITVQQEAIPSYPDTPLPTEPWTFPINVENRLWRDIAGPWLQSYYNSSRGSWNPYTEAPRTAHILWVVPAYSGMGGFIGSPASIQTGSGNAAYEGADAGIFSPSVYSISCIMNGRAYSGSGGNITCFDIRTGATLWSEPGSFNVGSRRGRSDVLYSFGTRFIAYDAISGAVILNVTGPGTTSVIFYNEPIVYSVITVTYRQPGTTYPMGQNSSFLIAWDTTGTSNDFTSRIIYNVTDPIYSGFTANPNWGYVGVVNDILVAPVVNRIPTGPSGSQIYSDIGINLTTGVVLYNMTAPYDPTDVSSIIEREGPATGAGYGLVYFSSTPYKNNAMGYVALNASTGLVAWVSEATDYPWGLFWAYMPQACANGMIIGLGYGGVYAFNVTNGNIVWHFIDNNTYYEVPYSSSIAGTEPNNLNLTAGSTYGTYQFGSTGPVIGGTGSDAVIYAPNTEHSPTFYYRGQGLVAIDQTTGQQLFKILGIYSPTAIAEGVLTASDSVNGYTYGFGKGDTATTVSTSSEVLAKGDSVLLKGTVLDMSSAQNGTAAVSDADQEAWMEYLHMQQPFPATATGVSVSLDALDPNNNFVHIGDATTDLTGKYSFLWQPELEGKYTVVASFYSTDAYYGSTAETSVGVTAAAATPTPTPTPAGQPDYTMPIVGTGIAMIIAVAVATVLLLRKRP
jgi:hypothetical protein